MQFRFIASIQEILAQNWDALWQSDYPFTRHAFLHALENSKSVGEQSGWLTHHLIGERDDDLIFAMPLYLKQHSYGEYVFDWAWADAYRRYGLDYYPKLLSAIPYTPATGPRMGFAQSLSDIEQTELVEKAFATLEKECEAQSCSSAHCLFPVRAHQPKSWLKRQGTQFHWFNRNYTCFDDFLAEMSSRKRKNIRRERQKVADQNLNIRLYSAKETCEKDWRNFYALYHRTYLKRSGRPGYLGAEFFPELAKTLSEHMVLAKVESEGQLIAGAVYFKDSHTLYGRYWGTLEDIDGLHFETCYYRGIEYAIEQGLERFDPGAQGEHKIQRGFQPVLTQSYHYIQRSEFKAAIADFCQQEIQHNLLYAEDARQYLPFKDGSQCLVDPSTLV
jgi:predicted N-acyltransferase